jgi:hypothetical protein
MKKINPTWILLLLLLVVVSGYFMFVHNKGKTSFSEGDFAITDTTNVTKFVFSHVGKDKKQTAIIVEKTSDGTWRVNEKYPVLMPQLYHFFQTISQLKVRDKLTEAGNVNALKMIGNYHTLVEIYGKKGLLQSYQLGPESKDHKGTIMKKSSSDHAFIVSIPGTQGALNPRYPMDLVFWRENLLFISALKNVQAVEVKHTTRPEMSFRYERDNLNSSWTLNGKPAQAENYFRSFRGRVYAESFAAATYPGLLPKLQQQTPTIEYTVHYFEGAPRTIFLFDLPENKNSFLGWVKGENELLTIQHFVMDRFLNPEGREML